MSYLKFLCLFFCLISFSVSDKEHFQNIFEQILVKASENSVRKLDINKDVNLNCAVCENRIFLTDKAICQTFRLIRLTYIMMC